MSLVKPPRKEAIKEAVEDVDVVEEEEKGVHERTMEARDEVTGEGEVEQKPTGITLLRNTRS